MRKKKKTKGKETPEFVITNPKDEIGVGFQEVHIEHLDAFLGPQIFGGRYGAIKREVVTWAKNNRKKTFQIFKPESGLDKKGIHAIQTTIAVALKRAHLPYVVRYSIDRQVFVVIKKELLKEVYDGSRRA